MYILPDDPDCPNCGAEAWTRKEGPNRKCRSCGYVQRLETDKEHWLHLQAEYDAEAASGA